MQRPVPSRLRDTAGLGDSSYFRYTGHNCILSVDVQFALLVFIDRLNCHFYISVVSCSCTVHSWSITRVSYSQTMDPASIRGFTIKLHFTASYMVLSTESDDRQKIWEQITKVVS